MYIIYSPEKNLGVKCFFFKKRKPFGPRPHTKKAGDIFFQSRSFRIMLWCFFCWWWWWWWRDVLYLYLLFYHPRSFTVQYLTHHRCLSWHQRQKRESTRPLLLYKVIGNIIRKKQEKQKSLLLPRKNKATLGILLYLYQDNISISCVAGGGRAKKEFVKNIYHHKKNCEMISHTS